MQRQGAPQAICLRDPRLLLIRYPPGQLHSRRAQQVQTPCPKFRGFQVIRVESHQLPQEGPVPPELRPEVQEQSLLQALIADPSHPLEIETTPMQEANGLPSARILMRSIQDSSSGVSIIAAAQPTFRQQPHQLPICRDLAAVMISSLNIDSPHSRCMDSEVKRTSTAMSMTRMPLLQVESIIMAL